MGDAVDPGGDGVDGVGVDEIPGEGRHLEISCAIDACVEDGFGNIAGTHDSRSGIAEGIFHGSVHEALISEGCAEAGIEIASDAVGAVALGAIGIQVGANAQIERGICILHADEVREVYEIGFILGRCEQIEVIPGAKLVVSDAGCGVSQFSVQLPRIDAEDAACIWVVAGEAIQRTGIIPRLRANAGGSGDSDILSDRCGDEVGVGAVVTPFVGKTVNATAFVTDEETGFETFGGVIGFVDGEVKIFNEHGSSREGEGIIGREVDFLFLRDRDPTLLHGVVRPEG